MTNNSLHWVTSASGGQFTYTTDGKTIREIAGAWFLFDQYGVVIGQFETRDAAVAYA